MKGLLAIEARLWLTGELTATSARGVHCALDDA